MVVTYRGDIIVSQASDQCRHSLEIIVDTPQQHTLIANGHARLQEPLRRHFGDPRELVRVVEVRVDGHRLPRPPCLVGDVNDGRRPAIFGIEQARGSDRQALGGEAEAADVRDTNEALADHLDVLWLQEIRVSAGNNNVLDLGVGVYVGEDFVPSLARGLD